MKTHTLDDYYRTVFVPDYDKKLLSSKTKTNREKLEKELDEFINKQFLSISLIDKACDNYLHKLDGKEETCVSSSVSEYCAHLLEWKKVINEFSQTCERWSHFCEQPHS